ncbi:MAG TPA: hypothetical protein PLV31_00280, partial [Gammaproteobacteria bacterium]|nr:hypothetical protein [Gammaproteobacteria bacterium]
MQRNQKRRWRKSVGADEGGHRGPPLQCPPLSCLPMPILSSITGDFMQDLSEILENGFVAITAASDLKSL